MADYHDSQPHEEADDLARVMQRRRRPPLSCTECRRRKLKCDRSLPCGQCVRSKAADSCAFVGPQPGTTTETSHHISPPISRMRIPNGLREASQGLGGMFVFDAKMGPKSSSSRVSKRIHSNGLHELRNRLRMLENSLGKSNVLQTPQNSISDVFSEVATSQNDTDAASVDDRVPFLPDSSFRGKKGKTRYFGRSHYTTTVSFFQDIGAFLRRGRNNVKDAKYTDMKKFKVKLWPRESQDHQCAFREQAFKLDEMVPSRKVADQLLRLYLDTFETTFRVLHIPTFLQQYKNYWASGQKSDPASIHRSVVGGDGGWELFL